jgi:hypothetical protein
MVNNDDVEAAEKLILDYDAGKFANGENDGS